MRKDKLLIVLTLILTLFFFLSCDDSGSGDDEDVNDATSLGGSLVLSGTVDQVFVTNSQTLIAGYTNPGTDNFRLYDESDGSITYRTDSTGDDVLDIDYDGTNPLPAVYSSSGWTGITSSNPDADMTTAVIDIDGTSDGIVYGNFAGLPAVPGEWYYYLYSTAETIMDGTYVDTDSVPAVNHIYDNIRFFTGWNRIKIITSDGETFSYTSGAITDGHWTYMDNTTP